ncbi:peroxisomal membrane protein [Neocallimastix lanati (nom. inval.)]|jgi:adenine nucleotide transporter 17|uniref:Peroxisomal membrane protein n=1 Tax=Neocallimastix californiae TaxID=1754190 RepID=A0A1Y1ZK01_9FUNG|nr:peroxisomal membrane protein [Neocallimastix sp. JGI-2020a]ORY10519.1 peroxisomal membrane protein [Neocallimastix californiae]|eukprot:ORY10519.1 peroxisomal membrane protein [Neocallimastix californiae]
MSNSIIHAISGAAAGTCATIVTYPLLTLTLRQAVKKENEKRSLLEILKQIIKDKKFLDLYSGLSSSIFGGAVTNGVYFFWYELAKSNIRNATRHETMNTIESMLASTCAGTATTLSTHPIWLINTRCAAKVSLANEADPTTVKSISAVEMLKRIIKEEGVLSLWNGIVPALILVINPVIQYTAFEQLRNLVIKRKEKLSAFDIFLLGAIAKLCATVTTYPYTVVKSRMQLRQGTDETSKYNNTMDAFKKIIKNEGAKGLYKGIQSKIFQSVLAAAFLFMFKDKFHQYVLRIAMIGQRRKQLQTI